MSYVSYITIRVQGSRFQICLWAGQALSPTSLTQLTLASLAPTPLGPVQVPGDLPPETSSQLCLLPQPPSSSPTSSGSCLARPSESPAHELPAVCRSPMPWQCTRFVPRFSTSCSTWQSAQDALALHGAHLGVSAGTDLQAHLIFPRHPHAVGCEVSSEATRGQSGRRLEEGPVSSRRGEGA